METCANYVVGEDLFFSSDEKKWIKQILRIAREHPEEVTIIAHPENNDGCIYVRMPANYLRIKPKSRRRVSDEERLMLTERMRNLNKKHS